MIELAELRQRVKAAGVRFREAAEEDRKRNERLSILLGVVEDIPELNPVENVWQFIRDNWLSNRVFKSYGDILDHCCYAWNSLIEQPWKIISIGTREWAHG